MMPVVSAILLVALTVAFARRYVSMAAVTGGSMRPTLADGDRLLVLRRTARRGDIAVFYRHTEPAQHLVKRVVAIAGDFVPRDMLVSVGAQAVPPGTVLVRGDNPVSLDSRNIGPIRITDVIGVVVCRVARGHTEG